VTLRPFHPWSHGDWVWVKTPIRGSLDPRWEGPYKVTLTTPSALKVAGLKPWIHHMHAKPAVEILSQPRPAVETDLDPREC
jgi:hypothetical protein